MFRILFFLVLLLFCSCNFTNKEKYNFFPATKDKYIFSGRYLELQTGVELINSAASVKTVVFGDSVFVHGKSLNEQYHYLSVEIGEQYKGRFRIKSETLKFELPKNSQGTLLTIYKDTEASNGSILIQGISADNIAAPDRIEKPTIEFIGNSVTCGMGADTREISCEDGEWYDQHNAYLAYGPRVARALNINFVLNCVSGMGMYRNWNDEDEPVMADVYPSLRLNGNRDEIVAENGHEPDIVSIALGTNDLSLGDGVKERAEFDEEIFTQRYILFVETIFSKYPDVKIALLSSPMIGKKENELLVNSLNKVKEHFKEKDIFIFEFEKMEAGGCTSHPDIEDHREIAEKLVPFYAQLLD